MSNGRDSEPVAFGRWQEAHRALEYRVEQCEERLEEIERNHDNAAQRRVNHRWQIILAILSAFLLPLIVAVLLMAIHTSLGQ